MLHKAGRDTGAPFPDGGRRILANVDLTLRDAFAETERRLGDALTVRLRTEVDRLRPRSDRGTEQPAGDTDRRRAEIERRVAQALGAWLHDEIGQIAERTERRLSETERRISETLDARVREEVSELRW